MTSTFLLAAVTLMTAPASEPEETAQDVLADLAPAAEVLPMCMMTAGNTKQPTYEDEPCAVADAEPVEVE